MKLYLSICLLILNCGKLGAAGQGHSGGPALAGMVTGATCTKAETWRAKTGKWEPLPGPYYPLIVGDRVRCQGPGSITLSIDDVAELVGPGQTRLLTHQISKSNAASFTADAREIETAFDKPASRDEDNPIVFPPQKGRIRAEDFALVLRHPAAGKLFISLYSHGAGAKLYEATIESATDRVELGSAKAALVGLESEDNAGRKITLTLRDAGERESAVTFSLLSTEEEKSLKQDLAAWNRDPDSALAHLGRAYVFRKYGMASQETHEAAAALKLHPDRALLSRCLEAEQRANPSASPSACRAN